MKNVVLATVLFASAPADAEEADESAAIFKAVVAVVVLTTGFWYTGDGRRIRDRLHDDAKVMEDDSDLCGCMKWVRLLVMFAMVDAEDGATPTKHNELAIFQWDWGV